MVDGLEDEPVIRYLLARYVDDLLRNEPKNVGIVVFDGEVAAARFLGEVEPGRIDLRHVKWMDGRSSYGQWVDYWRTTLDDPGVLSDELRGEPGGSDHVIERLISTSSADFRLELGGEVLVDADDLGVRDSVDKLFERLVGHVAEPPPPIEKQEKRLSWRSLNVRTRSVLERAGVPMDTSRFRAEPVVEYAVGDHKQKTKLSYAVMNGRLHYLQAVPFSAEHDATEREVTRCGFIAEHIDRANLVFAYSGRDVGPNTRDLVGLLNAIGPAVDVTQEDAPAAMRDVLEVPV